MNAKKATDPFCNAVVGRYHITSVWHYLVICLVVTLAIRLLQCFYKAWAFKYDDVPDKYKILEATMQGRYWKMWWGNFLGFPMGINNDLWLPTCLGLIELATYPVLIAIGQFTVVGIWIGIKTAGSWQGWRTSATAFNRFLFFNLLNLIIAYFLLVRFVRYVPCGS
jgi:hypothetical protein